MNTLLNVLGVVVMLLVVIYAILFGVNWYHINKMRKLWRKERNR